jgi:type IV pilus assembly protein PilY1
MADALGAAVASNSTGFVNPSAQSYWTKGSTFWSFKPSGVGGASDLPDGDIVEKGAAGGWLRNAFATSQASRKVYTCTGTCAADSLLSATPFDTSNTAVSEAATGATSPADLADLVNWVRGQDLYDENADGSTTDVRASTHGDVLHSRPALVNYNRYGDANDVMVFYGGNDGLFHAIQGGQIETADPRQGGTEQWSFIPSEFLGQLKRLRDNNVNIKAPNPGKPYFIDGPIGLYQLDNNNDGKLKASDGDKVHLFPTMRRGDRLLYALDVTDPAAPRFLWKRTNANTGYGEMGQTWSEPTPAKIRATGNPVLVMGAGYDPAAEDTASQGTATMGRGVMVIDATTGNVLWQVGKNPSGATHNRTESGMKYPIPADVAVIDRDRDGFADRLYAADTGGNIWRLDIDDVDPGNWTVTRLAELGGSGSSARKFLYAPDVVYGSAATQPYDAVLIGSGDREHPFDTTIVNRFYMIKDTNMGKSVAADFVTILETDLYDTTSNLIQVGSTAEATAARDALAAAKGWYLTLGSGEKVVSNATTMGGTTFFGTNQPSAAVSGSCSNLGKALLYGISFLDATATLDFDGQSGITTGDRADNVVGGGLPPPPVGIVTIIDGRPVQVVCSGTKCVAPPTASLGRRHRVYWHNNLDK